MSEVAQWGSWKVLGSTVQRCWIGCSQRRVEQPLQHASLSSEFFFWHPPPTPLCTNVAIPKGFAPAKAQPVTKSKTQLRGSSGVCHINVQGLPMLHNNAEPHFIHTDASWIKRSDWIWCEWVNSFAAPSSCSSGPSVCPCLAVGHCCHEGWRVLGGTNHLWVALSKPGQWKTSPNRFSNTGIVPHVCTSALLPLKLLSRDLLAAGNWAIPM